MGTVILITGLQPQAPPRTNILSRNTSNKVWHLDVLLPHPREAEASQRIGTWQCQPTIWPTCTAVKLNTNTPDKVASSNYLLWGTPPRARFENQVRCIDSVKSGMSCQQAFTNVAATLFLCHLPQRHGGLPLPTDDHCLNATVNVGTMACHCQLTTTAKTRPSTLTQWHATVTIRQLHLCDRHIPWILTRWHATVTIRQLHLCDRQIQWILTRWHATVTIRPLHLCNVKYNEYWHDGMPLSQYDNCTCATSNTMNTDTMACHCHNTTTALVRLSNTMNTLNTLNVLNTLNMLNTLNTMDALDTLNT
jgi:hypothetical protein